MAQKKLSKRVDTNSDSNNSATVAVVDRPVIVNGEKSEDNGAKTQSKPVDSPFTNTESTSKTETPSNRSETTEHINSSSNNGSVNHDNAVNANIHTETRSKKEHEKIEKDNAKREAKWQKKEMAIWLEECKKYILVNPKAKEALRSLDPKYAEALNNNQITLSMALTLYTAIEHKVAPEHGNHYYSKNAVSTSMNTKRDSLADEIKAAERLFKRHVAYAAMEDKFVMDYVKESDSKLFERIHNLHTESISYIGYADYRKNGTISSLSFDLAESTAKIRKKDWIKLYSMVRKFEIKEAVDGLAILVPPGNNMAVEHKKSPNITDKKNATHAENTAETSDNVEVEHSSETSNNGTQKQVILYKRLQNGVKVVLNKIKTGLETIGHSGKKLDTSLKNAIDSFNNNAESTIDKILKSLRDIAVATSKIGGNIKSSLKSTKRQKKKEVVDPDDVDASMGISKEDVPIAVMKQSGKSIGPVHKNVHKKERIEEVRNNEVLRPPGMNL